MHRSLRRQVLNSVAANIIRSRCLGSFGVSKPGSRCSFEAGRFVYIKVSR